LKFGTNRPQNSGQRSQIYPKNFVIYVNLNKHIMNVTVVDHVKKNNFNSIIGKPK